MRHDIRSLAVVGLMVTLAMASSSASGQQPVEAAPTDASPRVFADSRLIVRDRISIEVVGHGSDIVMIPGLASSRETWRAIAERLRANYRLHLVQVAGFAGEPVRGNAAGEFFAPVVADIAAYLATLGKPAMVMGHSLGGTFGLDLAQRHPELVSRLLVVDALPFFGVVMAGPAATVDIVRPMVEAMGSVPSTRTSEAQTRTIMAQMASASVDVDRIAGWSRLSDPAVVGKAMLEDMLADLRPGLAAIRMPVTVLFETPLAPLMTAGYATLPDSKLIEVPEARHFIMYDQPARFAAEVDAFLKRR